jgi:hypothetical protein
VVLLAVGALLTSAFVGPAWSDPIRDLLPFGDTQGCSAPGTDDRCEEWTAAYHDPQAAADSYQFPSAITTSRDDTTVYMAAKNVTGSGFDSRSRWAIVALDAETGAQEWVANWGDPGLYSGPSDIAASRDGDTIVVTGGTRTEFADPDGQLVTIAFDAATGAERWTSIYNGSQGHDGARSIVLDPKNDTFYVAGVTTGVDGGDLDYLLLAYDIASGDQLWVTRWAGIDTHGLDSPFALGIDPKGDAIYATGWSAGPGEYNLDYGTIAVDTATGGILWDARYDGVGVHAPDEVFGLTVSPKGDQVFVTGLSDDVAGGPPFDVNYDYATVAYDALTGAQLWDARTKWDGSDFNAPTSIAADPKGEAIYVTGQVTGTTGERNPVTGSVPRDLDFGTVAYSMDDGSELWSDRFSTPQYDLELGKTIAVSKNGKSVYVGGISSSSQTKYLFTSTTQAGDSLVLGYDAGTGARRWVARYNATGFDFDISELMTLSNDGKMLFTAGTLKHNIDFDRNFYDAGILAYKLDELEQ